LAFNAPSTSGGALDDLRRRSRYGLAKPEQFGHRRKDCTRRLQPRIAASRDLHRQNRIVLA
jgi:hypothetical protein